MGMALLANVGGELSRRHMPREHYINAATEDSGFAFQGSARFRLQDPINIPNHLRSRFASTSLLFRLKNRRSYGFKEDWVEKRGIWPLEIGRQFILLDLRRLAFDFCD